MRKALQILGYFLALSLAMGGIILGVILVGGTGSFFGVAYTLIFTTLAALLFNQSERLVR